MSKSGSIGPKKVASRTAGKGSKKVKISRSQRLAQAVFVAVVAIISVALIAPAPYGLEPQAFNPKASPALVGTTAPNQELLKAEFLLPEPLKGPESLTVNKAATYLYTGTYDGYVLRVDLKTKEVTKLAYTGGRPLGLELDLEEKHLIVCDSVLGLLSIDLATRQTTLLATLVEGKPMPFTNSLDIATTGEVYFTASTSIALARSANQEWSTFNEAQMDIAGSLRLGSLLKYDPKTREVSVLLRNLAFANGVALSRDESFILVVETSSYSVLRYWLKGDKAGTSDIFIENLPGIPDGITQSSSGGFWLSLFTTRNAILDLCHPYPLLKKLILRLPPALLPPLAKYGFVAHINEQGQITSSLQDPTGKISPVTAVTEAAGNLYIASLHPFRIGVLKL